VVVVVVVVDVVVDVVVVVAEAVVVVTTAASIARSVDCGAGPSVSERLSRFKRGSPTKTTIATSRTTNTAAKVFAGFCRRGWLAVGVTVVGRVAEAGNSDSARITAPQLVQKSASAEFGAPHDPQKTPAVTSDLSWAVHSS
jgi:hypothetical protein